MTDELLPCPFCGGKPYGVPSGHPGWVTRCGNCSARTVSDYGRQEAEKEWNRRTSVGTISIEQGINGFAEWYAKQKKSDWT